MIIYTPDVLRASVEAATGGRVTVLYDDAGAPSYMCVIPKFRYEDLGLESVLGTGVATAFSVDGVEKSEIFIGQYHASVINGLAVSLPGRTPRIMVSPDEAKAACFAKGAGWHLMTSHEWAAIVLWCKSNGFIPRGNTDSGRAHDATHEVGHSAQLEEYPFPVGEQHITETGSGPASWRHDGTISGISGLGGNISEWTDLLKTIGGQIYTTQDNDYKAKSGGLNLSTNEIEPTEWDALDQYIAILNTEDPPISDIFLQNTPAATVDRLNAPVAWANTQKPEGYTESQLLQRLLVSPAPNTALPGMFAPMIDGEYCAARGSCWRAGPAGGIASLLMVFNRSAWTPLVGFRPAFIF